MSTFRWQNIDAVRSFVASSKSNCAYVVRVSVVCFTLCLRIRIVIFFIGLAKKLWNQQTDADAKKAIHSMAYEPSYDCGASLQALVSAMSGAEPQSRPTTFCCRKHKKKKICFRCFAVIIIIITRSAPFILLHSAQINFVAISGATFWFRVILNNLQIRAVSPIALQTTHTTNYHT